MHKIDRIRPQPGGGAIVLIEDERRPLAMALVPSLSTLIAIARILNAKRVLATRYGGKGEVRYAAAASPPAFLLEAITKTGACVSDAGGNRVLVSAAPAVAIAPTIDLTFSELAHHVRTNHQATSVMAALQAIEATRRKTPLDRDVNPVGYWTAVFELAALAGELSRPRGGRWIDTIEMPVPFAVKLATGELAMPAKLAMQIVEGGAADASLTAAAELAPS